MASVQNMSFPSNTKLPDVKRPERQVSGPPAPDQRSAAEKRQTNFNQEWQKQQAISNPRNTPPVSHGRMNQGGTPGVEDRMPAPAGNFDSVNASAAGVGARTPVDAPPGSLEPFFQKSKASTLGSPLGSPSTVLKDGVYLPIGGFGTGRMTNVGNIDSPQAGAALNSNFTGQPSMYPVQRSVGQDIFGDTADLIKKRDALQSNMDSFFAKNPLGNDLMANFNAIASQAGNRREIKEIGDRLAKRDELVSQLFGIGMQGQNQMNAQGLQNQGQLQSTQLAGELDIQNTIVGSQGQLGVQDLAGKQRMDQIRAEAEGNRGLYKMNNAAELQKEMFAQGAETTRHKETLAANAKPYDFKVENDLAGNILTALNSSDVPDDYKKLLWEQYQGLFGTIANGSNWGASIKK